MLGCDNWQTECKNCPQKKYHSFIFDRSNILFKAKKELLKDLDLTIITPSEWLCGKVKQSFLKYYPVKVINNGINLDVFKPIQSEFRKEREIKEGKVSHWLYCSYCTRLKYDPYNLYVRRSIQFPQGPN